MWGQDGCQVCHVHSHHKSRGWRREDQMGRQTRGLTVNRRIETKINCLALKCPHRDVGTMMMLWVSGSQYQLLPCPIYLEIFGTLFPVYIVTGVNGCNCLLLVSLWRSGGTDTLYSSQGVAICEPRAVITAYCHLLGKSTLTLE